MMMKRFRVVMIMKLSLFDDNGDDDTQIYNVLIIIVLKNNKDLFCCYKSKGEDTGNNNKRKYYGVNNSLVKETNGYLDRISKINHYYFNFYTTDFMRSSHHRTEPTER